MTEPRIYTYKISFPYEGYFYYGAHKERKAGELYWGSPVVHSYMWKLYAFEKEVLEYHESWEEATDKEKELIRPDLDNPMCLNEGCFGEQSVALQRLLEVQTKDISP